VAAPPSWQPDGRNSAEHRGETRDLVRTSCALELCAVALQGAGSPSLVSFSRRRSGQCEGSSTPSLALPQRGSCPSYCTDLSLSSCTVGGLCEVARLHYFSHHKAGSQPGPLGCFSHQVPGSGHRGRKNARSYQSPVLPGREFQATSAQAKVKGCQVPVSTAHQELFRRCT
jgi:hypothetical protein